MTTKDKKPGDIRNRNRRERLLTAGELRENNKKIRRKVRRDVSNFNKIVIKENSANSNGPKPSGGNRSR